MSVGVMPRRYSKTAAVAARVDYGLTVPIRTRMVLCMKTSTALYAREMVRVNGSAKAAEAIINAA